MNELGRPGDLEDMTSSVSPEGPVSLQIQGLGKADFSKRRRVSTECSDGNPVWLRVNSVIPSTETYLQ